MKRIAITGFMASILMATGVAIAAEGNTVLTTKNYVDSGLRAVYQSIDSTASQASANAGDISSLQSVVNGHTSAIGALSDTIGSVVGESGLAYDVSELQSAVQGLQNAGYISDVSALQSAIETNAGNISLNSTAISEETTRATGVESGLDTRLTTAETDITTLKNTVNGLDGDAYDGENGIYVEDHKVGLNVDAQQGKMYIYTSTGWNELPLESNWNNIY